MCYGVCSPVCLEEMGDTARELPCAHRFCRPCLLQLWDVQQHNSSDWKSGVLTCPLCRAKHAMPDGFDALLTSVPRASHMMAVQREESARRRAEQGSIATLSLRELLEVCKMWGVKRDGAMERRMLEEEIMHRLNVTQGGDVVTSLTTECLKVILAMRAIPFQDCLEKQDLVQRVLQTPRGSCFKLPVAVLKAMLREHGCEGEVYVDKDNLARRIMAVRVLRSVQSARDGERTAGAGGEARSGVKVSADACSKRHGGSDGSSRGTLVKEEGKRGRSGQKCACVAQ